jgi:prophage antirepressor-like protein
MSDIILFHFEQSEIRFVGTADKPEWIAADICKVLGISNPSETLSNFLPNQKGISTTDIRSEDGTEQGREMLTVTESGMYRLIFKSRKPIAEKFQNWIFDEVLPSVRKTGSYSVDKDRHKLEQKFLPTPALKQLKEAYSIHKMMYGKAYADRWMTQKLANYHPALSGESPKPEELKSLPTTKALLTPTQIAEELGWKCKSLKAKGFDAIGVNKKLAELGCQEKIAGSWSATQKAINLNLCDRKPVDTNSRTQKDQLLWSVDVLPILQEHSLLLESLN